VRHALPLSGREAHAAAGRTIRAESQDSIGSTSGQSPACATESRRDAAAMKAAGTVGSVLRSQQPGLADNGGGSADPERDERFPKVPIRNRSIPKRYKYAKNLDISDRMWYHRVRSRTGWFRHGCRRATDCTIGPCFPRRKGLDMEAHACRCRRSRGKQARAWR
jgi:hypothetical protein